MRGYQIRRHLARPQGSFLTMKYKPNLNRETGKEKFAEYIRVVFNREIKNLMQAP